MLSFELYWLIFLLPLPLLIYRLIPRVADHSAALRVPFIETIDQIDQHSSTYSRRAIPSLIALSLIWLFTLLAAARPVIIGDAVKLATEARDMMLAVDISGSMDERDMRINNRPVMRIDSVKAVLSEFTQRRQGDRLGLILFADQAYLQAPLTYDTNTVKQLLIEAQLGFAGQRTAIGDALGLGIKRLVERPAESRTLILLTDGANNSGSVSPLDAAKLAEENGITVHTIGVGADEMVERSFFGNRTRNPSRDLDEGTLREIASTTGGRYFRAKNTSDLEAIYRELDQLEPVDQDAQFFRPKKQLFHLPLSIAFGLGSLLIMAKIMSRSRLFFSRDNTTQNPKRNFGSNVQTKGPTK